MYACQGLISNLIERKSRCLRSPDNGIFLILRNATEGEAVVVYREPSARKEMGYYRLSRRVNKIDIKLQNLYLTVYRDIKNCSNHRITH